MQTVWVIEDENHDERALFTIREDAVKAVVYFDPEHDSVIGRTMFESVEELLDFWREKGLGHRLDTRPL